MTRKLLVFTYFGFWGKILNAVFLILVYIAIYTMRISLEFGMKEWLWLLSQLFVFIFWIGYFFCVKTNRLIKWSSLITAIVMLFGIFSSPSLIHRPTSFFLADIVCTIAFLWIYIFRGTKPIKITAILYMLSKGFYLLLLLFEAFQKFYFSDPFLYDIFLAAIEIPFFSVLIIHQKKIMYATVVSNIWE